MSVFLAISLPFQMSALVLRQLSAFELKAWLGITLFASYITDIFCGAEPNFLQFIFILITVLGLIFIAKSGSGESINYREIMLPLVLYLAAKYSYGLIIKSFSAYASSSMLLLPALIIISVITIPRAAPKNIFLFHTKNALKVILARIPNTIGMLAENAVISISLTNYAFIQPMLLVTLFLIGLIQKKPCSKLNLAGSILCIIGIIAFQICSH